MHIMTKWPSFRSSTSECTQTEQSNLSPKINKMRSWNSFGSFQSKSKTSETTKYNDPIKKEIAYCLLSWMKKSTLEERPSSADYIVDFAESDSQTCKPQPRESEITCKSATHSHYKNFESRLQKKAEGRGLDCDENPDDSPCAFNNLHESDGADASFQDFMHGLQVLAGQRPKECHPVPHKFK